MSTTNRKDLSDSVKKVCDEFNLPNNMAPKLTKIVIEHLNNPRKAKKEALPLFAFNWQHDSITPVLLASEKENFSDNHISFLVDRIIALAHLSRQWRDAKKVSRMQPYLKICLGPTIYNCPLHLGDADKVFPVDSDYWKDKPLRENLMCKCSFRGISQRELEQ